MFGSGRNPDDRLESISSERSSFYRMNNRVILPGLFVSMVTTFPISYKPLLFTLALIVVEAYLTFTHGTDLFSLIKNTWMRVFGSKRKPIRN